MSAFEILPDRRCAHCGNPFAPVREFQMFCNVGCQREHNKEKQGLRGRIERLESRVKALEENAVKAVKVDPWD